jgi:hypothetical protein
MNDDNLDFDSGSQMEMTKGDNTDLVSQGTVLMQPGNGRNQVIDDLQSSGSFMVKGNTGNQFDDMSSQGSYMVRAGNADMQSEGSFMVRVPAGGNAKFDDMSS